MLPLRNYYFKGVNVLVWLFPLFMQPKSRPLEGNISIYSTVKYLGSKTLLYSGVDIVCRQHLNALDSTFILKSPRKNVFVLLL